MNIPSKVILYSLCTLTAVKYLSQGIFLCVHVSVDKSLLSSAVSPQRSRAEKLMRIWEGCRLSTNR